MTLNRFALLLVIALLVAAGGIVAACELCGGPTLTLAKRRQEATLLVVAFAAEDKDALEGEGSHRFAIQSIERDKSKSLKVGQEIVSDFTAPVGSRVLLTGAMSENGKLLWDEPLVLNPAIDKYLASLPSENAKDRLEFFAKHLEDPDPAIAIDAAGEFADAPFEEILPIAKKMSPDRVRGWLTNPKTPASRYAMYGMFLGLCGGARDQAELERRALALEGPESVSPGIQGITWGYVMLAGEPGLKKLEQTILHNPEASDGAILERVRTIGFLWSYGKGRIPGERLKQSLRPLLDRPNLQQTVIHDLSRYRDWTSVDKVAALFDPKDKSLSRRRDIVRFLVECTRDVPKDASEKPDHAVKAQAHLDRIQKLDPKVVEHVLTFYDLTKAKTAAKETGRDNQRP